MGTAAAKPIFYTQARWDVHRSIIGTIIPSQISQHHFLEIGCFFSISVGPPKRIKKVDHFPPVGWITRTGIQFSATGHANLPCQRRSNKCSPCFVENTSDSSPGFNAKAAFSKVLFILGFAMTAATSTVTSSWIEKQIKRRNLGTPDDVNDFKPGRKTWSSPEACGNTPNSLFVKDRVKFEQGPCVNGLMYACVYRYIYIYISVSVCVCLSIYLSI